MSEVGCRRKLNEIKTKIFIDVRRQFEDDIFMGNDWEMSSNPSVNFSVKRHDKDLI